MYTFRPNQRERSDSPRNLLLCVRFVRMFPHTYMPYLTRTVLSQRALLFCRLLTTIQAWNSDDLFCSESLRGQIKMCICTSVRKNINVAEMSIGT
jgi:hypothetical protein